MAQQRGMKRAAKVLKRKQEKRKAQYEQNLKNMYEGGEHSHEHGHDHDHEHDHK